jgi:hypothetical protein
MLIPLIRVQQGKGGEWTEPKVLEIEKIVIKVRFTLEQVPRAELYWPSTRPGRSRDVVLLRERPTAPVETLTRFLPVPRLIGLCL